MQVSKTGALIDSMTLAPAAARRARVLRHRGHRLHRRRQVRHHRGARPPARPLHLRAGTTLTRADAKTVKLGTTIGNIGLEGVTQRPATGGFLVVKETDREGIFQTGDRLGRRHRDQRLADGDRSRPTSSIRRWPASATSPTSSRSPTSPTLTGAEASHLLIISQESGKIVNVDRTGNVASSLTIVTDPDNPLSVPEQTHEGVTMDDDGILYVVNENGGGDADHPQLWVYEPSSDPDQAPTAVALTNQTTSLPENTSTATRIKLADVEVTDDGIGNNDLDRHRRRRGLLRGRQQRALPEGGHGARRRDEEQLHGQRRGRRRRPSAPRPTRPAPLHAHRHRRLRRRAATGSVASPRSRPGAAATAPTPPTGSS